MPSTVFLGWRAPGALPRMHLRRFFVVPKRVGLAKSEHPKALFPLDQRIAAASGSTGRSAALEQAAASQVADASARLALARSEAARGEELFRGGWLTRTALDQRRQALAAAT